MWPTHYALSFTFFILWSGSIVYIWHCYSSHTSTRPCPHTFGEKRRLQHSTCTLWIRSAFVLGVWTWCLEQSATSAERHRCCLHIEASLKVWTLLSSLRHFDDCFQPLLIPEIVCITDWCFFFIDDMCVSSFNLFFSVIRSVCWHLFYIVKHRRPYFVGGAIEIPLIDWLIDWTD